MVSLCRMLNNQRHQQLCLLQRPLLQGRIARKSQELTRLHQSRIGALLVGSLSLRGNSAVTTSCRLVR